MPTKTKIKRRKRTWRDVPDTIILALAPPTTGRAASLSPDSNVTWGYLHNHPECVAIIDAWRFEYPVTVVVAF